MMLIHLLLLQRGGDLLGLHVRPIESGKSIARFRIANVPWGSSHRTYNQTNEKEICTEQNQVPLSFPPTARGFRAILHPPKHSYPQHRTTHGRRLGLMVWAHIHGTNRSKIGSTHRYIGRENWYRMGSLQSCMRRVWWCLKATSVTSVKRRKPPVVA